MDEIIIENVEETQQESTVNKGNVKISTEVVATIAGIAANEINGVSGMCGNIAGGIAELLGSKSRNYRRICCYWFIYRCWIWYKNPWPCMGITGEC